MQPRKNHKLYLRSDIKRFQCKISIKMLPEYDNFFGLRFRFFFFLFKVSVRMFKKQKQCKILNINK